MEYERFKEELLKQVSLSFLGEEKPNISPVKKTNAEEEALCIPTKEPRISRVLYLRELYEKYRKGASLEELSKLCTEQMGKEPPLKEFDFTKLTSEQILERVKLVLRNQKWNRHLLETCPHLDTGIGLVAFPILEFPVGRDGEGRGITYLTHQFVEAYLKDFSIKDLLENAKKNSLKEGYRITPVSEILRKLGKQYLDEDTELSLQDFLQNTEDTCPLYVLTNPSNREGAVLFLYRSIIKEAMEQLNEKKGFYILPSSIEEVLLIPKSRAYRKDLPHYKSMVREINNSEVPLGQRLSDDIYEYDGASGVIRRVIP